MVEQLQAHLRMIGVELASLLGAHLPALGGAEWWNTRVEQQLTYGQQGQVRTRRITTLGGLDVVALLRVLERNWMDLSHIARLPGETRTLARELVDLRHFLAHHASDADHMAPQDVYRHLDTMVRFLAALSVTPEKRNKVEQARLEALMIMARRMVPALALEKPMAKPAPTPPAPVKAPKPKLEEPHKPSATIGAFRLIGPGDSMATEITSFAGSAVPATAIPWTAKMPGGLDFLLHVVLIDEDADSEFGQVYCESRLGSPQVFDDIVHRLRLGIRRLPNGLLTMDLRFAGRQRGARSARRVVSLPDMDAALGINVAAHLKRLGARAVGTRAEVTGETGRTRNWPCVTFDVNDLLTPTAAYVVSTLMPLMK